MNRKFEVLNAICDQGIVAVLRSESEEQAVSVAKACVEGGVNLIEVTFSVPSADAVIKRLTAELAGTDAVIGAGTVIDDISARLAVLAGAQFIVAPTFDKDVAMLCNHYGVPYVPGCMTVNEIDEALRYGVDMVKLFPASEFKPGFIKSIKAPLPQVNVMVTGGINVDNTAEWIKAGAVSVGVGGNLTKVNKASNNPFGDIAKVAADYRAQIAQARA